MSAIFGTLMLDAFILEIGIMIGLAAMVFFGLWLRSLNSEKSIFKGARDAAQRLKEIERRFDVQGLSIVNDPEGVTGVFKAV